MDTYPLPWSGPDARFNAGLLFDVRRVLREHGYPAVTGRRDLVRLHLSLFTFLYGGIEESLGHEIQPDDAS